MLDGWNSLHHDGSTPDELLRQARQWLKLALGLTSLHTSSAESDLTSAIDRYNALHERYRGNCHGYLLNVTPT